jgi:hypothetical protein
VQLPEIPGDKLHLAATAPNAGPKIKAPTHKARFAGFNFVSFKNFHNILFCSLTLPFPI